MKIKRIIPHPKYDNNVVVYDIALLEMKKPLECSGKTSPVCLPTKDLYETGQKIFIAGWGMDTPEGFEESNPVDDEMDEDEDNNYNESTKGPLNSDAFSVLETAMEKHEQ
ncbi:hypothetical protein TNCV_770101 [Trichonephila clavipes]|nr:hypothetical protein TNCV_770101 [Trichonephila clavipes]